VYNKLTFLITSRRSSEDSQAHSDHIPIPRKHRKTVKIRALIASNVELNSLREDPQRAPHKKSDIPIDQDNAIYLARTCKNPYNIDEFFCQPSHRGIYVLAGGYNKRFSLRHMDPFHWINDSAFGKKGTQDLVVKTKYVSKDGALERNLLFTRMNYFIEGEQRFVVQYLGDPSTALRHEGQGFGPPDSDSSPNDLIPRWQAHMSEHGNEPISGDAPATTDEVDKVAAAPEYTLSPNPTKELSPVPRLQAQLDALMAANDQERE